MKQQIWSGLLSALFITTVGATASSQASQEQSAQPHSQSEATVKTGSIANAQPSNAIKMGERQSQTNDAEQVVAQVQAHRLSGRQAATLYLRNTPILTFLGSRSAAAPGVKVASNGSSEQLFSDTTLKGEAVDNPQDPVWRATAVAAKLNQLQRQNIDASLIKVLWDAKGKHPVIRAGKEHVVELDAQTVAVNPSRDLATNAIQITNQIRRQLGNAPPLRKILGQSAAQARRLQKLASGPLQFLVKGWASWYGPGFQGNPTANGERFNQYAMTAAHRTLPFGTKVQVTNLDNGRSVIVRINDRGPFSHGRVLDLSRQAAQVLGVINSGVAPVRIDVMK